MKDFLTRTQTAPPPIPFLWYGIMIALVLLSIYGSFKYHSNPRFVKLFKWIQIVQLIALYTWYFGFRIPFANSLPLYHCRLAMFAVVFLPDKWRSKQYFALMGASGAVFALGYPVFDPYDFPHITSFSFLIGHYALLVNSLVYLLNHYDKTLLKKYMIVAYTFILNLFLVAVNQVTGGNYGLLKSPPFVPNAPLWLKYLLVSLILSLALVLFDELFKRRWKKLVPVYQRADT
ncbi:putative membrane protein [Streptococcus sp. DD11]|uniref:YwaF family protein n=1 Tax=Streptococcus sp. DD11 TaxID=1777879 RepID=UPI0007927672|nr:TIGR02206 family membrane protein [Streptococcus sp. DD11]KXT82100.1 putative membrane protein [Streptococcus sp. DD11]